ncbi:polysaccharide deacetylase family protein [Roseibium sp. SCPC15]|uniref:polysaccharide deacetylase family protein n=1 Tax=Roseibium sp. SCP15 TaxID=3141376 RepID=UPI00333A4380
MLTLPILMYHSVAADVDERYRTWSVTPERFSEHMQALAKNGYAVLGVSTALERLDAGTPLPDKTAILTFDDGLKDFLENAFPVLDRHGFEATLYVVAGLIAGHSKWLTPLGEGGRAMLQADEIRHLHTKGIEIGAHSLSHPEMDILDSAACERELRDSRSILEEITGGKVKAFAYPHGYASAATRRLTRDAGFSSAVRVRHALSHTSENRFGLSRLIVTQDYDQAGLISLLEGKGIPTAPPQDRIAGTCWRLVRRIRNRLTPPLASDGPYQPAGGPI